MIIATKKSKILFEAGASTTGFLVKGSKIACFAAKAFEESDSPAMKLEA